MAYKDQGSISVPGEVKARFTDLASRLGMSQPETLLGLIEYGREGLIKQRLRQLEGAKQERREQHG